MGRNSCFSTTRLQECTGATPGVTTLSTGGPFIHIYTHIYIYTHGCMVCIMPAARKDSDAKCLGPRYIPFRYLDVDLLQPCYSTGTLGQSSTQ